MPRKRKSRQLAGTTVDEGLKVDHALREYAIRVGVPADEVERQIRIFGNKHLAEGTVRVRWDAMLRLWFDRYVQLERLKTPPPAQRSFDDLAEAGMYGKGEDDDV